jgi:hypothetical protein
MTTEAVIMSIARTPIGKTSRGVFNLTRAALTWWRPSSAPR